MQTSSKNLYLDKLRKNEPEKFKQLVQDQYAIAKVRYTNIDSSKLLANIILILENPNQYENLNRFGQEDIVYSALELVRRACETMNNSSIKTYVETEKKALETEYSKRVAYTGEHRELRSQADKDNFEAQLKCKGKLEFIEKLQKLL